MATQTFFSKVWNVLKKLFKNGATWEKAAQSVITYAAPIVETIVGLAAGGPAENLVTGVINIVQSDLATVGAVIQGATVAPGTSAAATVETALGSIKDNLSSLLTAAEVKNSAKSSDITAAVNLLVGEVDAMLTSFPAASNATPAAPAAATAPAKS